jgi:hypothetical protein
MKLRLEMTGGWGGAREIERGALRAAVRRGLARGVAKGAVASTRPCIRSRSRRRGASARS